MRALDEILEQAKRLSPEDRRRLVENLEKDLLETGVEEARRLVALDHWLARAGSGHSAFTDVARDKYKHLAEVYADKK